MSNIISRGWLKAARLDLDNIFYIVEVEHLRQLATNNLPG